MQLALLVAALVAAPGTAALAQPTSPAPAPSFSVPHAYAGYAQPEVTQCRTVNPGRRECVIPAMVAGRYLVDAAGVATASGAGSNQSLTVTIGSRPCMSAPKAPFTGKANLHLVCQVTVLTDAPITVAASYSAEAGTVDPAGPQLVVRRVPWDGILESRGAAVRQRPAAGSQAPAKPAPAPKK